MKWAKLFWVTNARGLRQGKVIFVQTFMFQMWLGLIASVNISNTFNVLGFLFPSSTLKRISVRYSGDAYSFQCGMQSLIWSE